AGDVCYQQAMSTEVLRWLYLSLAKGVRVLLADPGRAYAPRENLTELARYEVPTSRDLEDRDSRTVVIGEQRVPERFFGRGVVRAFLDRAVFLHARRAQAAQAVAVEQVEPGLEFLFREAIAVACFLEGEQAAAHRGDDLRLA